MRLTEDKQTSIINLSNEYSLNIYKIVEILIIKKNDIFINACYTSDISDQSCKNLTKNNNLSM